MLRPIRLLVAAAFALLPLAAPAAEPSAQQAEAMQSQLREWLHDVFGPAAELPQGLIEVAPEADHYRITVQLNRVPGVRMVQGGEIALSAQPLPNGRWLLYHYRIASPVRFSMQLPAGVAGNLQPRAGGFAFRFDNTAWHGILDPSFASPTIMAAKLGGYDFAANVGPMGERAHTDSLTGDALLAPAGNGRLDVSDQSAAENFSLTIKSPDLPHGAELFVGHAAASGKLSGLDPARVRSLFRPWTPAAAEAHAPNAAGIAAAREGYLRLRGIATGGELLETVSDLRVASNGHIVDVGQVTLGGGIDAAHGMLNVHMTYSVDSVTAPDIPASARAFVPRHVLIRPTLSGIRLADLDALIMAASTPGVQPSMEQPQIAEHLNALFAHGGITAGIDELEVDVGATKFTGFGKVVALSPKHFRSEAVLSATNFDALVAALRRSTDLGKFAPLAQLVGMLGQHEGGRIIWRLAADNTNVQVNGLDIQALIAAGKELERH